MSKLESHLHHRVISLDRTKAKKIVRSAVRAPKIAGFISMHDIDKPRISGLHKVPSISLCFDDEIDPELSSAPTQSDIEKIIGFAKVVIDNLTPQKFIVCNCEAGICRSTAAAFIVRCMMLDPGQEDEAIKALVDENPGAFPNILMIRWADLILNRNGKMIDAFSKHFDGVRR